MKVAFDTSVIVAALLESHPNFATASPWIGALDAGDIEGVWTTHAYAETWAVLTRLPIAERVTGQDASRALDSLAAVQQPTALDFGTYQQAAQRASEAGGRSGIIFDAVHLVAAEVAGSEVFLTYNVADFERLHPQLRVEAPIADIAEFRRLHGLG